jgi:hypothetical protein
MTRLTNNQSHSHPAHPLWQDAKGGSSIEPPLPPTVPRQDLPPDVASGAANCPKQLPPHQFFGAARHDGIEDGALGEQTSRPAPHRFPDFTHRLVSEWYRP